jgi:hypothetical protein
LIAVLSERIKAIIGGVEVTPDEFGQRDYLNAILVLIEVIFFLYAVSPSVAASYKLCTSMLLSMRFAKQHLPNGYPTLAQRLYELTRDHLVEVRNNNASAVKGFLPLETLNLLLAIRELGDAYLLSEDVVKPLFKGSDTDFSYFQCMCCLFYVKDSSAYASLREEVIAAIEEKLHDLSDVLVNTEKCYLLLDMLCCPFISQQKKRQWIRAAYSYAFKVPAPSKVEVTTFLGTLTGKTWQVDWTDVDLLSMLEKKELKQVYQ